MSNNPHDELDDNLQEWPFPGISPEAYYSMPEAYRAGIELIVRDMTDRKNTKH